MPKLAEFRVISSNGDIKRSLSLLKSHNSTSIYSALRSYLEYQSAPSNSFSTLSQYVVMPEDRHGSSSHGSSRHGSSRHGSSRHSHGGKKGKEQQMQNKEHWEWFWSCCACLRHAGLPVDTALSCPEYNCGHYRCDSCPMEAHKVRDEA